VDGVDIERVLYEKDPLVQAARYARAFVMQDRNRAAAS
jgi:hypothetical protein